MAQKPSTPKGVRDFLPETMMRREFIFDTLRSVFRKYGYLPIETPAMENLDVLTGKYGEEGDRLIFKILNSGEYLKKVEGLDLHAPGAERKLTPLISEKALRYDLTVPFARFVVMNQNELTFPFRRYQIQPVWRADRPQQGRYREFYQCDCDVIGSNSLVNDAELVGIYDEAFGKLGFEGVEVLISNRKILSGYAEVAGAPDKVTDICVAIDKLDKIGPEKVREELVNRGLDAAAASRVFELIEFEGDNAAKLNHLEAAFANSETGRQGVAEMREVLSYVSHLGLNTAELIFDLKLARGLDYYTGTIYEVKAKGIDYGSIGGGGRYDDLTGIFGLKGMPGVGISFGADRIYDVMEKLDLFAEVEHKGTKVMFVNFGADTLPICLKMVAQLRKAGVSSEMYPDKSKLGKQFGYADKRGIPWVVVIGAQEADEGRGKLKNMHSGEEEMLSFDAIKARLREENL